MNTAQLGLVKFEVSNLGEEVWLVEHPAAAQRAWDAAIEHGSGEDSSPLDAAAAAGGEAVVLRASWGNDIPDEGREEWLAELLARVNLSDHDEVADLVDHAP